MKESVGDDRNSQDDATRAAAQQPAGERYILRLFITGITPRSERAIKNIQDLCTKHLQGRYELQVIDVYQQPSLAVSEQVFAVPTLIKVLPLPLRRLIGDMSDEDRVLVGLDIVPSPH